jgi:hypothetical protein
MPKKNPPEGSEDPLVDKYNSGVRMLRSQNIFLKFYAQRVTGNATDRSTLIREALNAHIKQLKATLSPEEWAEFERFQEEEMAQAKREALKKAQNVRTAPKKKGRPAKASGASHPKKVFRKAPSGSRSP